MALTRVTMRLTELRCVRQSEGSNGSEPYLWVTYFAFGAQPSPLQLITRTPAYDAFRTEFPDGMTAGRAATIPPFLASTSFDMDLTLSTYKLVGCIAVLMEQDETPHASILLGRIAYSKAIDEQLTLLVQTRISTANFDPITDAEIATIKTAVKARVESAIASNQSVWNWFTDQDDNIGFTYKTFSNAEIAFKYFDFPEIVSGSGKDRFVLSGGLSLGPALANPVDLCAGPRAAVNAKKDEINSLNTRTRLLQDQLQHASPQAKAALVAEIRATHERIALAQSELSGLHAALQACESRPRGSTHAPLDGTISVNRG